MHAREALCPLGVIALKKESSERRDCMRVKGSNLVNETAFDKRGFGELGPSISISGRGQY